MAFTAVAPHMAATSQQKASAQQQLPENMKKLQRLRNQGETNPNMPAGGKIKEVKWDS